jgi:hypothetical protein
MSSGAFKKELPKFPIQLLSFSLFFSAHKTRPRDNWNNLKNTPKNYFHSVVFLHPQSCFSSYSLVIYGHTKKKAENKKGL